MTVDFATLAGTLGPTAAVLLYMWMNRQPTARDKAEDPVAKLAEKLNSIESHVIAIENRVIDMQAEIKVLKDRRH